MSVDRSGPKSSPPSSATTQSPSPTTRRPALGRGLSALLPGAPAAPRGLLQLPLSEIVSDEAQPRRHFDEVAIEELASSVRAQGVLQPILVRRLPEGGYRIVAGERRFRASKAAGLSQIPVIVKEISETEAFEIALIENIQREDLNPIEEAEAYQRLVGEHGLTQEDIATRVGKDRSTIANALRLLRLPQPVRERVMAGELSSGHAKVLLSLPEDHARIAVADQIVARGLSVREAERLVQKRRDFVEPPPRIPPSPFLKELAERLQQSLATRCEVRLKDGDTGEIAFKFKNTDQAESLLRALLDWSGASAGPNTSMETR